MFCLAELKTKAALALCQLAQALNCDQKVLVTTEKSAARIPVWWPSDSSPGGEAGGERRGAAAEPATCPAHPTRTLKNWDRRGISARCVSVSWSVNWMLWDDLQGYFQLSRSLIMRFIYKQGGLWGLLEVTPRLFLASQTSCVRSQCSFSLEQRALRNFSIRFP